MNPPSRSDAPTGSSGAPSFPRPSSMAMSWPPRTVPILNPSSLSSAPGQHSASASPAIALQSFPVASQSQSFQNLLTPGLQVPLFSSYGNTAPYFGFGLPPRPLPRTTHFVVPSTQLPQGYVVAQAGPTASASGPSPIQGPGPIPSPARGPALSTQPRPVSGGGGAIPASHPIPISNSWLVAGVSRGVSAPGSVYSQFHGRGMPSIAMPMGHAGLPPGAPRPPSTMAATAMAPPSQGNQRGAVPQQAAFPRGPPSVASQPAVPSVVEEAIPEFAHNEDEEEEVEAEIFNLYKPPKLSLPELRPHPGKIVETSSLSAVEPPDVTYQSRIVAIGFQGETFPDIKNQQLIGAAKKASKALSAAQLESIVYASQRGERFLPSGQRCGFFLGDGPGVGKGRQIAGLILENFLHGRKRALWLTVSNDLLEDSMRDLRDIGLGALPIFPLHKHPYGPRIDRSPTYLTEGVLFSTYSSLLGKTSQGRKSRMNQILQWCGSDFEGLIIFDECHKAKNLYSSMNGAVSKTGKAVLDLQSKLPRARVLYCSATGASEVRHMGYMTRLGLWKSPVDTTSALHPEDITDDEPPFTSFLDFVKVVERCGVGGLELVAMELKRQGLFLSRHLSFLDATYRTHQVKMTPAFSTLYLEAVSLWHEIYRHMREVADAIDKAKDSDVDVIPVDIDPVEWDELEGEKVPPFRWAQYWGSHQRFFRYLCIASKVDDVVQITKEALAKGKAVVIGLQSTGEAHMKDNFASSEFVSSIRATVIHLLDKAPMPPLPRNKGYEEIIALKEEIAAKGSDESENGSDETSDSFVLDEEEDEEGEEEGEERSPKRQRVAPKVRRSSRAKPRIPGAYDESVDDQIISLLSDEEEETDEDSGEGQAARGAADAKGSGLPRPGDSDSEEDYLPDDRGPGSSEPGEAGDVAMDDAEKAGKQERRKQKQDIIDTYYRLKEQREKLRRVAKLLPFPPNPIDNLIQQLGGTEHVAEMTGRRVHAVYETRKGKPRVTHELRGEKGVPLDAVNLAERNHFMSGRKLVAIISDAASAGISLQADARAANKRRRVHITIELPWAAQKAIQQFGRTHRSNQVCPPEYVLVTSPVGGELRFAAAVGSRLANLGALTQGDRNAIHVQNLASLDVGSKLGEIALKTLYNSLQGRIPFPVDVVPPPPIRFVKLKHILEYRSGSQGAPPEYNDAAGPGQSKGNKMKETRSTMGMWLSEVDLVEWKPWGTAVLEKHIADSARFFNRLLGLPLSIQRYFVKLYTDIFHHVASSPAQKRKAMLDDAIAKIRGNSIKLDAVQDTITSNGVSLSYYRVRVERGMDWAKALALYQEIENANRTASSENRRLCGFYQPIINNRDIVTLFLLVQDVDESGELLSDCSVYRPATGKGSTPIRMARVKAYRSLRLPEAERLWTKIWVATGRKKPLPKEFRLLPRRYLIVYLLSGSILRVWSLLVLAMERHAGANKRLRTVRVEIDDDDHDAKEEERNMLKVVGVRLPSEDVVRELFAMLQLQFKPVQKWSEAKEIAEELKAKREAELMAKRQSLKQSQGICPEGASLAEGVGSDVDVEDVASGAEENGQRSDALDEEENDDTMERESEESIPQDDEMDNDNEEGSGSIGEGDAGQSDSSAARRRNRYPRRARRAGRIAYGEELSEDEQVLLDAESDAGSEGDGVQLAESAEKERETSPIFIGSESDEGEEGDGGEDEEDEEGAGSKASSRTSEEGSDGRGASRPKRDAPRVSPNGKDAEGEGSQDAEGDEDVDMEETRPGSPSTHEHGSDDYPDFAEEGVGEEDVGSFAPINGEEDEEVMVVETSPHSPSHNSEEQSPSAGGAGSKGEQEKEESPIDVPQPVRRSSRVRSIPSHLKTMPLISDLASLRRKPKSTEPPQASEEHQAKAHTTAEQEPSSPSNTEDIDAEDDERRLDVTTPSTKEAENAEAGNLSASSLVADLQASRHEEKEGNNLKKTTSSAAHPSDPGSTHPEPDSTAAAAGVTPTGKPKPPPSAPPKQSLSSADIFGFNYTDTEDSDEEPSFVTSAPVPSDEKPLVPSRRFGS